MLINDKLYKLSNGQPVEFTTDDIPEGTVNKYSAGGLNQILTVAPWELLPANTKAYQVSDGAKAYAVTTGPYSAYQVSDGAKVYHVTTGNYTTYQVSDGAKAYEIATDEYTAYGVSDGATVYKVATDPITIYEVTNGPAAYAIQTEEFTSYEVKNSDETIRYVAEASEYTKLYKEKELLNEDTAPYETPFNYTGVTETVKLTGYADSTPIDNATFYLNIELTQLMSFGYKQKDAFSLVDGTKLNGVIAYVRTAGSIGEVNSSTMYSDKELTTLFESGDTFKYNSNTQSVTVTGYVASKGDTGSNLTEDVTVYKHWDLADAYVPGGIPVTDFKYTDETALGHNYYTDQSGSGKLTNQKIYSDTLLREEVADAVVTDYSWTNSNVDGNVQTCFTSKNTELTTAEFFTTNKLSAEYTVKGAKTKADFHLTGNEYYGHLGYVEGVVFTEIYTDKYLRDLASDYTVEDFKTNDVTEVVSQEGWSKTEEITEIYTTDETNTLYEIKGAKTLEDFYRDGQTAFGHIGYVATDSAIDTIYSDILLTKTLSEGELEDFEYTDIVETASGQNAYVATSGEVNEHLVSQTMYKTKYLDEVFNPVGAKTTQSFYYTGVSEMGHIGYVKESGTGNLTNQTIYTNTYLLEELEEGIKTDYKYTGQSFVSERAFEYTEGDKYINSSNNKLNTYTDEKWVQEDLSPNMIYIGQGVLYYFDKSKLQALKPIPYKNDKTIQTTADTKIMLVDSTAVYKVVNTGDNVLDFDTSYLTQTGYFEFELYLKTDTILGQLFKNKVTWLNSANVDKAGNYLFKIRTFDFETWLGELEISWD